MTNRLTLRGTALRYTLTHYLHHHGPASITELATELDSRGFRVGGRPSKTISDALRWEIEHGRVYSAGRGRYRPASMPRSTEHRIHQRVLALRAAAARQPDPTRHHVTCRSEAGTHPTPTIT